MTQNDTNLKVVIGLGKTGVACVNYLCEQGFNVAVIDSRIAPPGLETIRQKYPQMLMHLGDFAASFLSDAAELIVSPGVSLQEPHIQKAIQRGVPAIGDIEIFAQQAKAPIVAITGSNGKSTVTTLVGAMAKTAGIIAQVGGNLGTPALDLLDPAAELYVVELSSFQLETTHSLKPVAATVLNICEDHMDRYTNLQDYVAAKQNIYRNCQIAVINHDDPVSFQGVALPPKVIDFGVHSKDGIFSADNGFIKHANKNLLLINDLKIKGLHQVANALAALSLGTAINLPLEAMLETLRTFGGLPHRCQWVRTLHNVNWYNDSKGTNVGATKAAIEGLGAEIHGKIVLIAGGLSKDADFSLLRETVSKYVRTLILIGKDAKLIATALANTTKIVFASSMQQAVAFAAENAVPYDAVLLSPACASFDMFKDFEHRGRVFIEEVSKL